MYSSLFCAEPSTSCLVCNEMGAAVSIEQAPICLNVGQWDKSRGIKDVQRIVKPNIWTSAGKGFNGTQTISIPYVSDD